MWKLICCEDLLQRGIRNDAHTLDTGTTDRLRILSDYAVTV